MGVLEELGGGGGGGQIELKQTVDFHRYRLVPIGMGASISIYLEGSNLPVELHSFVHVRERHVHTPLHDPHRSSCQHQPLKVQTTH